MRVCYLILLHQKFDQALRLIRRLAGADCGFTIHIDRATPVPAVAAFRRALERVNVTYAPRVRSRWGSYGLAAAMMQAMGPSVCGWLVEIPRAFAYKPV